MSFWDWILAAIMLGVAALALWVVFFHLTPDERKALFDELGDLAETFAD